MSSCVDQAGPCADLRTELQARHQDEEATLDGVLRQLAQRLRTQSPPAEHQDEHQDDPSAYPVIDATTARALASAWARGPLRLDKPGTSTPCASTAASTTNRAGAPSRRDPAPHPQDPALTEVLGPRALAAANRRMQRLRARLTPSAAPPPSAPLDRFACDLTNDAPASTDLDVQAQPT